MARRRISSERKTAYYLGMGLIALGFLLFGSVFVTGAMNFGDFSNFESNAKSSMFRALGGMALMIVGGIMMRIGVRGAAGSGLVLDPQRARKDVEPWARMAGGIVKDVVDETGLLDKKENKSEGFEEKLRKLHSLYQEGILTKEEYEQEKKEILDEN